MDIQQKTMKSPSKDSSDSPDKKRKSLKIAPLLKPVALSISNSYGLDWYLINVENNMPRKKRRYFIDLSFFSDELHKFIPHSLHLLKYPNWSAIFLATTPRSFMNYQAHFPMKPILTFTPMIKTASKLESWKMKIRPGHLPVINNSRPSVIRRRRK
ncbi:uncharacterized protein LOC117141308 [Drosophila mauritiana]|uniref:Uncharacterized protein LOC117141308 n=1 Tax=Drosophila mauritiana TaxID=7226 RepID=A0A6P8KBN3_DROMA|nr:uncharacterized protein LOC117141308 [Drosophila mauritiana]